MAALSILTTKFVAIGLSKELAGNYNSVYGYLQLFGILADFGLYAVAVREVSRAIDRVRVMGALIILRSIILAFSLASALAFVWIMPAWRGTPLPLGVTIASLVPFFTLLAGILRTIFQVHYKMQYVFIAEVAQRIVTVSMIGFFIFLGVRGSADLQIYHMFLFVGGIGAFVLFLVSFVYGNSLEPIRIQFDKTEILRLLSFAAPYGAAYLCMALYRQLDVTLIALLRPDFELQNAYYGFAARMGDMAFLFPTFLLNSTLPIVAERDANKQDNRGVLGKTFLLILLLGTVSSLFAFFWARPLVMLLTTEQYLSTAITPGTDTALALLALPMFLNGLILYSFYVLLTRHAWQTLVSRLVIGSILSLALNLYLIPSLGFVGAAYTSIIVHSVLVLLLLPLSMRTMPMKIPSKDLLRWITFALLFGGALAIARPLLTNIPLTILGIVAAIGFGSFLGWILKLHRSLLGRRKEA